MTILGVSGISSSFMEEKMVGNAVSREKAFQAAEATLRHAELWLAAAGNKDTILQNICGRDGNPNDSCNRSYDDDGNSVKADGDDLGDSCGNGYCTPREQDFSYNKDANHSCASANYIPERWQSCPTGSAAAGNNLNLFTTAGFYQEYPVGRLDPDEVAQMPRYIIEFLGYRVPDGEIGDCDQDGSNDGVNDTPAESAYWPFCTNDIAYFRITALGYGGTVNTRVMLQTTVLVD